MENRTEPNVAAACLVAPAAVCTGFAPWLIGAGHRLRGDFEGQGGRDLSVLYVEPPVMTWGVPALALAAWAPARVTLHGFRAGRTVRTPASASAGRLTLDGSGLDLPDLAGRHLSRTADRVLTEAPAPPSPPRAGPVYAPASAARTNSRAGPAWS